MPLWIPILIFLVLAAVGALVALLLSRSCSSNAAVSGSSSSESQAASSSSVQAASATTTSSSSATSSSQAATAELEPEPAISYLDAYAPVIAAYKTAMENDQANDPYVNPEAVFAKSWVDRPLSYGLVDPADDGSPELVIAYKFDSGGNGTGASGQSSSYRTYDVYGLANGQPQRIVNAQSLGNRSTYVLYQGCYVLNEGWSSAIDLIRPITASTRKNPTCKVIWVWRGALLSCWAVSSVRLTDSCLRCLALLTIGACKANIAYTN